MLRKLAKRTANEDGITGLETAIILIAFVVVATVFAFVVLTSGVFSSERGKETVFAGLQKARGTIEIRGGVVATSTGGAIDTISFAVASTAAGESIPIDPTATNNRTVIAYRDSASVDDDVSYTVTPISGDGDTLLEPGELSVITIAPATDISPAPAMGPNTRFTLELQTPVGAVIDLTRQLPTSFDAVMQLH
jgi:flagellin FlaB